MISDSTHKVLQIFVENSLQRAFDFSQCDRHAGRRCWLLNWQVHRHISVQNSLKYVHTTSQKHQTNNMATCWRVERLCIKWDIDRNPKLSHSRHRIRMWFSDCGVSTMTRDIDIAILSVRPCLVLMNDWQTSSWSITPMGGGGALRHATCDKSVCPSVRTTSPYLMKTA